MNYKFNPTSSAPIKEGHLELGGRDIAINSRYLSRNGIPFIPIAGEYHFSRDRRENWRGELQKMKQGGITMVSTYLFWIYHEETEGEFNFSGDFDIKEFILAAADAGLEVILRIGPWAHGECRNGGFPDWLLKKSCIPRTNDPAYLKYVRKWYSRIYEEVKDVLEHVPVIQLENELTDNAEHLLELRRIAEDVGLRVPIYTVTGWNSKYGARIPEDKVLPVFGGYCTTPWTPIDQHPPVCPHYFFNTMRNDSAIGSDLIAEPASDKTLDYDRYPFATCELGGGIQCTYHRRPYIDPMDIYALSLVKLGSGNNFVGYYMYHGGTNKIGALSTFQETTDTGYPNDYPILSYDFQAPIGEYGDLRPHYYMLRTLHMFINSFGKELAPMDVYTQENTPAPGDTKSLRYCMRKKDDSGFIFINHHERGTKLEDVYNVCFDEVSGLSFEVRGDTAFILPFGMDIEGERLEYASAQPLCRISNTYFFFEIPCIKPVYKFSGSSVITGRNIDRENAQIVTLTQEEALYSYIENNTLYMERDSEKYEWCGREFALIKNAEPVVNAEFKLEKIDSDSLEFNPGYADYFDLSLKYSNRKPDITYYKLTVSSADGFINILPDADMIQLYTDGTLAADFFSYGKPWGIPASLVYGKEAYVIASKKNPSVIYS